MICVTLVCSGYEELFKIFWPCVFLLYLFVIFALCFIESPD